MRRIWANRLRRRKRQSERARVSLARQCRLSIRPLTQSSLLGGWRSGGRQRIQGDSDFRLSFCEATPTVSPSCAWRGGRVVYRTALEMRSVERHRGFESHPLRQLNSREGERVVCNRAPASKRFGRRLLSIISHSDCQLVLGGRVVPQEASRSAGVRSKIVGDNPVRTSTVHALPKTAGQQWLGASRSAACRSTTLHPDGEKAGLRLHECHLGLFLGMPAQQFSIMAHRGRRIKHLDPPNRTEISWLWQERAKPFGNSPCSGFLRRGFLER
jgi:hypothetical protein